MSVVHEIALKPRGGLDEPSKFEEMKKGPFDESRGRGTEAPHPGTLYFLLNNFFFSQMEKKN